MTNPPSSSSGGRLSLGDRVRLSVGWARFVLGSFYGRWGNLVSGVVYAACSLGLLHCLMFGYRIGVLGLSVDPVGFGEVFFVWCAGFVAFSVLTVFAFSECLGSFCALYRQICERRGLWFN